MSKLYVAIKNRKNGKLDFSYGIAVDPGEIGRNLSEMSELNVYDLISKFEE